MNDPNNGHLHDVRQAVLDRVEATERFAGALVDEVCAKHPEAGPFVRKRLETLRASGLLGPLGRGAVARPDDAWDDGQREALGDTTTKFDAIGPYQPLEELGRGGQAVVYLAEDVRLNRPVALKVLKGLGSLSETLIRRFRREAEIASKLDHPGICPVYDAGVRDGIPYFAMRYLRGDTLADRIEAARAARDGTSENGADDASSDSTVAVGSHSRGEIHRILALFEKAAQALHAAHEAGIVHRDVKPGNIMVTATGDPVLVDFGLAGDEDGGLLTLTETGDMIGTPAYMSPEQLLASRVRVDRRTDVYSLGVTLFEALTLERPFRAKTRGTMIRAIQFKDPIDIQSANDALPADVRVVVETALEKDRDRRYQTALDFAEDLRRLRTGEPISARPVGAAERTWRWAKRRPMRAALLVVLAVGLPVITALAGYVIANRPVIREAEEQAFLTEVERHLEAGFGELAHGDPVTALRSFDAALALKPDSGEATGGKAFALFKGARYEDCLTFLTEARGRLPIVESALDHVRVDALRALDRIRQADALEKKLTGKPRTALGSFLAGVRLMKNSSETGRHQTLRSAGTNIADTKRFRVAKGHLEDAVLTAPHARPLFHFQLAHVEGHLEEEEPCRKVAGALLTLWPESFQANRWSGFALDRVGRSAEAIAVLEKAVELAPDSTKCRTGLGMALFRGGRIDEAIAAYEVAIELAPNAPGPHHGLGTVLCEGKRDLDAALVSFGRAIELNPNFANAHYCRGVTLEGKRRGGAAVAAYRKTIELNPNHALAHFNLGTLLKRRGRVDESIPLFEKAIALAPGHVKAKVNLGVVFCDHTREYDRAIELFAKAIELRPKFARAHTNLGVALHGKGEIDKAVAAFKKSIDVNPGFVHAYVGLGRTLLFGKEDYDGATAVLSEAVRRNPRSARAWWLLGEALTFRGRLRDAVEPLGKAIRLRNANARDTLRSVRNLLAVEAKLAEVTTGQAEPRSVGEIEKLATLARFKKHYGVSTTLYEELFRRVAAGENHGNRRQRADTRSQAARAAALAGAGRGLDAANHTASERADFRRQARCWLEEALLAWKRRLEDGKAGAAPLLNRLYCVRFSNHFASVRDADALAELSAEERRAWERVWAKVDDAVTEFEAASK